MKILTYADFVAELQKTLSGQEYLAMMESIRVECRSPHVKQDGCDMHHVHPKALGGLKDSETLKLSAFEHCKAHALLAKAIPCKETLMPVKQMSCSQIRKVADLDRATLEDMYQWSEILEEWRKDVSRRARGRKATPEQRKRLSERMKGRKAWNKGIRYVDIGLVRKLSEKGREHIRAASMRHRGWVVLTSPEGNIRRVDPRNVADYIEQGYIPGYVGPGRAKNTIHIHKEGVRKMVSSEELESYLKDNWILGRGIPAPNRGKVHSEETRGKIASKQRGLRSISKDGKNLKVLEKDLPKYLSEGWVRGLGYRRTRKAMTEEEKQAKREALQRYWNSPEGFARREKMKKAKKYE